MCRRRILSSARGAAKCICLISRNGFARGAGRNTADQCATCVIPAAPTSRARLPFIAPRAMAVQVFGLVGLRLCLDLLDATSRARRRPSVHGVVRSQLPLRVSPGMVSPRDVTGFPFKPTPAGGRHWLVQDMVATDPCQSGTPHQVGAANHATVAIAIRRQVSPDGCLQT